MLLSTSTLLTTRPPSSSRQVEALIEGGCFDVARHTRGRTGRMSGVDMRGLDLAYPSPESQHRDFDFLEPVCAICSDFPLWLQHTTSEEPEPRFFCLGPLRRVIRGVSSCRLCRVVLQSIALRYGIIDHDFPLGLAVCLYPRGKAAFDVKLSVVSPIVLSLPDLRRHPRERALQLKLPPQHNTTTLTNTHTVDQFIRVFDINHLCVISVPQNTPYCALRYNAQGTVSSTYNQGCLTKSANPDYSTRWIHLPASVKHAAALTQRLGHRYLWIDWLCDDPCPRDPEVARKQLVRLPGIFANAEFTILVGIGKDDERPGVVGVYKMPEFRVQGAQFGKWMLASCLSVALDPPGSAARRRMGALRDGAVLCSRLYPSRCWVQEQEDLIWSQGLVWSYGALVLWHVDEGSVSVKAAEGSGSGKTVGYIKGLKGAFASVVCVSGRARAERWRPPRLLRAWGRDRGGDERRPLLEKEVLMSVQ